MNSNILTVTEIVRHFSDYISRVPYRNESFILCKGKKPVAELRPLSKGRRLGDLPTMLASLPHLSKREVASGHFTPASLPAYLSLDLWPQTGFVRASNSQPETENCQ